MSAGVANIFGAHGLVVIEPDWIRGPLSRRLAHIVTQIEQLADPSPAAAEERP